MAQGLLPVSRSPSRPQITLGSTPALRMRRVPRLHHPSQRKQLQAPRHGHGANATVRMRWTTKKTSRMRAICSTVPRLRPSSEGDFHGNSAAARMRIPSLLLPNQEQEVSCRPGVPRSMLGNAAATRVSNGVTWALLRNAVLHGGNGALDK